MNGSTMDTTAPLPPLDREAERAARLRQARLTKPTGSLGRLEDLVAHAASVQRTRFPRSRPALALIAASDHGVTRHGVSAYPSSVTRAMLDNLARGGAAASVLAAQIGVPLVVLDVGVAGTPSTVVREADACRIVRVPIDEPLGDLREAAAVGPAAAQAVRDAARKLIVEHARELAVLVVGEIGIGNTTAAAAVVSALTGAPAELTVGRGTGVDDEGLARKRLVVREALSALGDDRDPWSVLARVGGRDLLALASAAEAAMERDVLVLVDGFVASAAVLALDRARPGVGARIVAGHRSAEPGHALVLERLGARPLLDLGMRLGEATGALAALPLLDLACALHARMATFEEAGVPDRLP